MLCEARSTEAIALESLGQLLEAVRELNTFVEQMSIDTSHETSVCQPSPPDIRAA